MASRADTNSTPRPGRKYLAERLLMREDLPQGLFPKPNSTSNPPTYYLGWVFDSRRIVAWSNKHSIAVYDPDILDPDASDEEQDPNDPESCFALGVAHNFNVPFTATAIAKYLFQATGFDLPISRPINIVWTPRDTELALSLCDNFTYANKPTDAQLEQIQDSFGFSEPPMWMLSGLKNDWTSREVHTH